MLLQSLCDLTWPSSHTFAIHWWTIHPATSGYGASSQNECVFPRWTRFLESRESVMLFFGKISADFVDCWRIQKYTSALRMVVHIELAPGPEGFFERTKGWTLVLFSFFPFNNCVLTYKDTPKIQCEMTSRIPIFILIVGALSFWHILISSFIFVWKGNWIGATECAHGRGQWRDQ